MWKMSRIVFHPSRRPWQYFLALENQLCACSKLKLVSCVYHRDTAPCDYLSFPGHLLNSLGNYSQLNPNTEDALLIMKQGYILLSSPFSNKPCFLPSSHPLVKKRNFLMLRSRKVEHWTFKTKAPVLPFQMLPFRWLEESQNVWSQLRRNRKRASESKKININPQCQRVVGYPYVK